MNVSQFLANTPQRADDIHRVIFSAYFCICFLVLQSCEKKSFDSVAASLSCVTSRQYTIIDVTVTKRQWLYIACLFQIGLTPVGYEDVPRGLKPQIWQPTGLQILTFPVITEVRFVNSEFTQQDGRKKRTAKRFFVTNVTRLSLACFRCDLHLSLIFLVFYKKICLKEGEDRWKVFSNKIIATLVTLGLPSSFRSSPVA